MATYTENYNLTMPEEDDYYNVEAFNENFETIDTLMAETEGSIHEVNEKIGASTDTNAETIFSKLNEINTAVAQGGSLIKSIQRITVSMTGKENQTLTINAVDPSRCIVLLEHLHFPDVEYGVSYTLNSTSISTEIDTSYPSKTFGFGFWIIEFY